MCTLLSWGTSASLRVAVLRLIGSLLPSTSFYNLKWKGKWERNSDKFFIFISSGRCDVPLPEMIGSDVPASCWTCQLANTVKVRKCLEQWQHRALCHPAQAGMSPTSLSISVGSRELSVGIPCVIAHLQGRPELCWWRDAWEQVQLCS